MEVHYHPKHQDKPKKIKEYLSEFLIIFFAVTCGFFAENLREYIQDNSKENEYMRSMISDLKTDTSALQSISVLNEIQAKGLDSLMHIMENMSASGENDRFYYYDLKYTFNYNGFIPARGTLNQLKNTGEQRLIKNEDVSRVISQYDNALDAIGTQTELLTNQITKVRDMQTDIIDFLSLKKQNQVSVISGVNTYPALLKSDKMTIHSYYFNIAILKGIISSYAGKLKNLKRQNTSLLKLIEEEYN
jgi:hypothetical protein